MDRILTHRLTTPAGEMIIGSVGGELCLCDWASEDRRRVVDPRLTRCFGTGLVEGRCEIIERAVAQLTDYFAGNLRDFSLPLRFAGTDFRRRVWEELMRIPYGTTISYSQLAERIGNRRAIRAVAAAVGANALSIIVPCHRVVGADGSLTGYAGGLEAKRFLLDHEASIVSAMQP